MKKIALIIVYCFVLLILSGCSSLSSMDSAPIIEENFSTEITVPEMNVINDNNIVVSSEVSASDETERSDESAPFKTIAFEMGYNDNVYMVTIENSIDNIQDLSIFIENSKFESVNFKIEKDENGYVPYIPVKNSEARSNFKVIKGNIVDDIEIPDILPIKFILTYDSENYDTLPKEIIKYYAIVDLEFVEIPIYDKNLFLNDINSDDEVNECEDILPSDNKLIPLDSFMFIKRPEAVLNDSNFFTVDIKCFYFDVVEMSFTSVILSFSVQSPYMGYHEGYKIMAIADEVASIFSMEDNNIKVTNKFYTVEYNDARYEDYYYVVDDERFSTLDELKNYTMGYFSEEITDKFMKSSDMYLEIEGKLCKKAFNLFETQTALAINDEKIITGCSFDYEGDYYFDEGATASFFLKTDSYAENGALITENNADHIDVVYTENSAQNFIITNYN